jgi:hypothetical protein
VQQVPAPVAVISGSTGAARVGFMAAARARLVFGSKALTFSRMPPVPDSAIRFDCRLVPCTLLLFMYYRI